MKTPIELAAESYADFAKVEADANATGAALRTYIDAIAQPAEADLADLATALEAHFNTWRLLQGGANTPLRRNEETARALQNAARDLRHVLLVALRQKMKP